MVGDPSVAHRAEVGEPLPVSTSTEHEDPQRGDRETAKDEELHTVSSLRRGGCGVLK